MSDRTDILIGALSEKVAAVTRLPTPTTRALRWLAFAAVFVGALVAIRGHRADIGARLADSAFAVPWAASLLVAISAAFAAFRMTVPGTGRWIAVLPLPPLAVWLATLGTGCVHEISAQGLSVLGTSFECLEFIVMTSLPLAAVLVWMLRRAAPLAPASTFAMGALAAAAAGSTGLELFHHIDTSTEALVWHFGTVGLVTLIGLASGRRALSVALVNE
ncbi:MAG: DUF1109 family protein [Alphaproteobacteria bacterium]|nr:DUF1109 family protein [Alphaproteobacteria bacterium]